ncbi:MAG: hypothetical protein ACXVRK_15715, partial [Gaiellaceae bacterium]
FSGPMVTWVPLEAFLLTATAGVVIVPGAVAAILRPQGRSQAAFAWMASVLIVLTLIEASLPGAKEGRFKERYLFALLPLVALAFGVYVKNARSHKWIVLLVAGALIAAAPQLPFSYYNAYAPQYDAWSLTASWLLKQHLGASTSSAVIALYVTAAAALAILIAIRLRVATLAMPFAIGAVLITTVAAIHVDFSYNYHATDRSWIAAASHGQPVTAVATPSSSHFGLLKQLYWSPVVNREVVLASAVPTDAFVKEQIKISRDGALGGINGGYFLFDRGGTQASFSGAAFVTGHDEYALYHSRTTPRFRILIENRNPTGWIAQIARLREWPLQQTERPGVLFTLSLPLRSRHSIHVKLGTEPFVLRPGTHIPITCGSTTWPLTVLLVARESTADAQGRRVSVRLTDVKSASGGPLTKSGTRCTRARP